MRSTDVLIDGFERVSENVHAVLDGITADQLTHRPGAEANTIAWLIWHLTRAQDVQIADVADRDEVWTSAGFYDRFDLPFEPSASGYGQSPDEVARVSVGDPALLADYYDATHAVTVDYLGGLTDDDLDRVIDENWDPPVTLGVRLVSIVDDDAQHVGQAAYVRGLLD
ncbi:DinB family protein [Gordonia sp. LSe1-13]|uniref:DinB family protein n=1 Tax=Gordonia sesuvii TaxID=3116777 RepID=A0ABU7M7B1_9ACTN|nr:DinB family protein [Gordonia sp. LSe1-13]